MFTLSEVKGANPPAFIGQYLGNQWSWDLYGISMLTKLAIMGNFVVQTHT